MRLGAATPIVAAVLASMWLSGCSYTYLNGVSGSFTAAQQPLLGYYYEANGSGALVLGDAVQPKCIGYYGRNGGGPAKIVPTSKGYIFKGEIHCLDGRAGEFEFALERKQRSGTIDGVIDGEKFSAKLNKPANSTECGLDHCIWGFDWARGREGEIAFFDTRFNEAWKRARTNE